MTTSNIVGCGELNLSNPCGLNIYNELFGSVSSKNRLPSEKMLQNMIKYAFFHAQKNIPAPTGQNVEDLFKKSLDGFFSQKNRNPNINVDSLPMENIRQVFHSTFKVPAPVPVGKSVPSIQPSAPRVIPAAPKEILTPHIEPAQVEAVVSAPEVLKASSDNASTFSTKVVSALNSAANFALKKEVLITAAVITIAIVAYKILSKPSQPTEVTPEKKTILPPPITTSKISEGTQARIAQMFAKLDLQKNA